VHIDHGIPSEFLTLSDWMRDASAFNICTSMRFFKHFLHRKMFSQWRECSASTASASSASQSRSASILGSLRSQRRLGLLLVSFQKWRACRSLI